MWIYSCDASKVNTSIFFWRMAAETKNMTVDLSYLKHYGLYFLTLTIN